MRAFFPLMAVVTLAACGSPASDDPTRGNSNGVTVELPPPTPFKPAEEAAPEANAVAAESEAAPDLAKQAAAKAKEAPAKAEAPDTPKENAPPPAEAAPKAKAEVNSDGARLLPARIPLADAQVARTIERIGFPCGNVVASNRVENPGGDPVYKIVCSSGASHPGTNKGGRLFFREWTGRLTRD